MLLGEYVNPAHLIAWASGLTLQYRPSHLIFGREASSLSVIQPYSPWVQPQPYASSLTIARQWGHCSAVL